MPNKTATLPLVLSILSLCCSIVCAALLLRGHTDGQSYKLQTGGHKHAICHVCRHE